MSLDYDVAIIGAGAAGIGAARRLDGARLSSVVLEASGRVGGRAWTEELARCPIDFGCGYLHSGDRNPWTGIAEAAGFHVDRRDPAWLAHFENRGFSAAESAAADAAFAAWEKNMRHVAGRSDCAADALDPDCEWNAYLQAMSSYINGVAIEHLSIADYLSYQRAASEVNWRVMEGYGTLVAASLPVAMPLYLNMPVDEIGLDETGVKLVTKAGVIRARAVIITVSTAVLAGDAIRLPAAFDPWRQAARRLPLGEDEKYLLEITGGDAFAAETHVIGNPRDASAGSYYIRPFGRQLIECFVGGEGARLRHEAGPAAAFAMAIDEIVALFGANVRRHLRPLACSAWSRLDRIGGAYSHALPGHAAARVELARTLDERVFFAGEATHVSDFSTAHGAYETGLRAAAEVISALGLGGTDMTGLVP
jgi:monoamine oxidase